MHVHNDLPLDWFASSRGVSLTDAELKEAVQDWLHRRGVAGAVLGVHPMAQDDTVVALGAGESAPAG